MTRIFTLALFLCPFLLAAQANNWDTYLWQYEKGPGSMLVDMDAKQAAPVGGQAFLLVTGVRYKSCRTDGLPSSSEFEKLYDISDSVKALVDRAVSSSRLVATFSYQCLRLDYYYLSDTVGLREQLLTLYKKQYPAYSPVVSIKADSSWGTYLEFLYPNEAIREYMKDQKAVAALAKSGDRLSQARTIDHWLYFKTESDRKCMFDYLAANQFLVESMDKADYPGYPFRLHISRNDKAELSSISQVTRTLSAEAKKCQGIYDGWESPVMK